MDVEHVVADHLLPHPAGPLRHLQRELVQVGANWRAPEAAFAQQLVLNGRPLLRHVLEGVLLSLREEQSQEYGHFKSAAAQQTCSNNFARLHQRINNRVSVLPPDAPCTAWPPGLAPQRCV